MKILLATGGSGGHIFPALVTAKELRRRGHDIVFGGVFRQNVSRISAEGFPYVEIKAKGLSTDSPIAIVSFSWATFVSLIESVRMLKEIRPDIVVGFGGYGSFSLVLTAALKGIPTILQEQNVVPGKANRVLSFFAKKIAVGFESAKNNFPPGKVYVSGCPSRAIDFNFDRTGALKMFGLPEGIPVILVAGGSQGSHKINEEFLNILGQLRNKISFGVIHICGTKDFPGVKVAYENSGVPHAVFDFTGQIDKAYALADLVISRAGAMTVTELAAFAVPAILIPYPHAGGHQRNNARVLSDTGVSRLIDEKDLYPDLLEKTVLEMLAHKKEKAEIQKCYEGIFKADAAERLVDLIEGVK